MGLGLLWVIEDQDVCVCAPCEDPVVYLLSFAVLVCKKVSLDLTAMWEGRGGEWGGVERLFTRIL